MDDTARDAISAFRADADKLIVPKWRRMGDWIRERLSRTLLTLVVTALGGSALAIAEMPVFAGIVCAGVALASTIIAVYRNPHLNDERRMRRAAWRSNKRLEQDLLKKQIAIDEATLALSGEGPDREVRARFLSRHPDLGKAVRLLEHRARDRRAESSPASGRAARRGTAAAPSGPDTAAIRRRREQRIAKLKTLEAEIQSMSVPGDAELAAGADEARAVERALRDAAREAERVAHERRRRGLTPSPRHGAARLRVAITEQGVQDVARAEPQLSPEEIVAVASGATSRATVNRTASR